MMEATSAETSCTPPMKIEPRTIHSCAGSHPNQIVARMGSLWVLPPPSRRSAGP
jgi:hypothetical protein